MKLGSREELRRRMGQVGWKPVINRVLQAIFIVEVIDSLAKSISANGTLRCHATRAVKQFAWAAACAAEWSTTFGVDSSARCQIFLHPLHFPRLLWPLFFLLVRAVGKENRHWTASFLNILSRLSTARHGNLSLIIMALSWKKLLKRGPEGRKVVWSTRRGLLWYHFLGHCWVGLVLPASSQTYAQMLSLTFSVLDPFSTNLGHRCYSYSTI